jgi:hypothetical protein
MNDRAFYIASAVVAVLIIAFSLVWPQGLGKPSPAPFGHAVVLPDYYRMVRERDERRTREAQQKAADAQRSAALRASADSASAAASADRAANH